MKHKMVLNLALAALCFSGCSSPTSESPSGDEALMKSLSVLAVGVSDVSQETSDLYLNPISFVGAEVRDGWIYHLELSMDLSTGDTGLLAVDAQFTNGDEPIAVPLAIYRDIRLNLGIQFDGEFKGDPTKLDATFKFLNPERKVAVIEGEGALEYTDMLAVFRTDGLVMDLNSKILPTGEVELTITQPGFGDWVGGATFNGTANVHVVVSNGVKTFDLYVNLLTGEIG